MSNPRETSFFVDPSKRSLIFPGLAADKFYSMSVRGYRRVDKDIAASGTIYSDLVRAQSWRYRPSTTVSFAGDITGTIQGVASSQVILDLAGMTDDGVLSRVEKPQIVLLNNQIHAEWDNNGAKATQLGGIDSQVAAASAAVAALDAYLTGLKPAWNDLGKDTPIDAQTFQVAFATAQAKLADLAAAIADRAAQLAVWKGVTGPGKPADYADVTGNNTSKDTNAVGGRPAQQVIGGIDEAQRLVGELDKKTASVMRDVEAARASADSIRTDLTNSLAGVSSDLKAARDSLSGSISSLNGDVAGVRGDLVNARSEISGVRKDTDTARADLTVEVARAKGDEKALRDTQVLMQADISGNATNISDEKVARADADRAINAVTTKLESRSTPGGGNLLSNTEFTTLDGWRNTINLPNSNTGINLAGDGWHPFGENVLGVFQNGENGSGVVEWQSQAVPVIGGEWYQVYGFVSAHRTRAWVSMFFFDGADNFITFADDNFGSREGNGGTYAQDFDQVGKYATRAPDNARSARFVFRKYDTTPGQGNSYGWLWRPYLGRAFEGQTSWNPYSHGTGKAVSVELDAKITREAATRTDAVKAVADRSETLEAQMRGDRDSTLAARIRDTATAAASATGAVANRVEAMEVTSSTGSGVLNVNPSFVQWPDGQPTPSGWDLWGPAGTVARIPSGANTGGYAVRINGDGTSNYGLAQESTRGIDFTNGWYVMEADVELHSGTWAGSGMTIQGRVNLSFASDPDTYGAGANNDYIGRRKFTKLVKLEEPSRNWHLMVNWSGFDGRYSQKSMTWYRCAVRPATDGEIKAQRAEQSVATALANIRDEKTIAADATKAVADRTAVTEAKLNGTQDSKLAANIRDEQTARVDLGKALAGRIETTEAKLEGTKDSVLSGRVTEEARVRAEQDGVLSGRSTTIESNLTRLNKSYLPANFAGGPTEWGAQFDNGDSDRFYFEDHSGSTGWDAGNTPHVVLQISSGNALYVFPNNPDGSFKLIEALPGETWRITVSAAAWGAGMFGSVYFDGHRNDRSYVNRIFPATTPAGKINGVQIPTNSFTEFSSEIVVPTNVSLLRPVFQGRANGGVFLRWMRVENVSRNSETTARLKIEEDTRTTQTESLTRRAETLESGYAGTQKLLFASSLDPEGRKSYTVDALGATFANYEGNHGSVGYAMHVGNCNYFYFAPKWRVTKRVGQRLRATAWVYRNADSNRPRIYWQDVDGDNNNGRYRGEGETPAGEINPLPAGGNTGRWIKLTSEIVVGDDWQTQIYPTVNVDPVGTVATGEFYLSGILIEEIADVVATNASITEERATRARETEALAGRAETIESKLDMRNGSAMSAKISENYDTLVKADQALAGRSSALEASSNASGNLLSNTDFVTLDGWAFTNNPGGNGEMILNGAGDAWHPGGDNALTLHNPGVLATNAIMEAISPVFSVGAGQVIQGYAMTASHRSRAWVSVFFYNADGANIAYAGEHSAPRQDNGGRDLNAFDYTGFQRYTVPDGATQARLVVRLYGTGGGDPYAWFIRPYVGYVKGTQTEWNPYSPGSGKAQLIGTNAAIKEEARVRTNAVEAVAGRTNTIEAQLRGEQGSTLATRITDETSARTRADETMGSRTTSLESLSNAGPAGTINANPMFSAWPTAQSTPTGWGSWGGNGSIERGASENNAPGTNSVLLRANGNGQHGMQTPGLYTSAGWYVLEAEVYLASGTYVSSGITLGGAISIDFAGDPDTNDVISTTGPARRKFSKLIKAPAYDNIVLHPMASWDGYGRPHTAKDIYFNRVAIRPASDAEIKAGKADSSLNGSNGIVARVGNEEQTRARETEALGRRANTIEAQIRGEQDSTLAARIRDEALARTNTDNALTSRTSVMETAATVGGSSVPNDKFARWDDGQELPWGWNRWVAEGNFRVERHGSDQGSPYCVRTLNDSGDVDSGFCRSVTTYPGKWVVEVTAKCDANVMEGAGITLSGIYSLDFISDPDTNGRTGNQGSTIRTWVKMFDIGDHGALTVHAMHGWTGFGKFRAPKYVYWYKIAFRPATAGEIEAGKANATAASLTTRISQEEQTRSGETDGLGRRLNTIETKVDGGAGSWLSGRIDEEARVAASATAVVAGRTSVVEAQVSNDSMNMLRNGTFNAPGWVGRGAGGSPPLWGIWSQDNGAFIGASPRDSRYGAPAPLQIDRNGLNNGISQGVPNVAPGWYVFEVDVTGEDGNWSGSGVHCNFNNGTAFNFGFATNDDNAGRRGDIGTANRSFSWMFYNPVNTTGASFYLMAGWTGFQGDTNFGFFRTIWHRVIMRPATEGEILARKVTDANVLARVTQTEGAVSDLKGKAAAYWQVQSVAGNNRAQMKVWADANAGAGVDIIGDVRITGSNGNGSTVISGAGVDVYYPNGQRAVRLGI